MEPRLFFEAPALLTEFAEYRSHFGLWRSLARAGYVLSNRLLRTSILDCLRLTMDDLDPVCLDPQSPFECRFLSSDEVSALAPDPANALPPHFVRASIENGDRCFGILDGDGLASYGWYARRTTTIMDDWSIRFDPNYAYMYRGYTLPGYRGLRLHALGVSRALQALVADGVRGLLSNCERTNYRSWVSVARMGWTRCGTFYRLDIGRRRILRASAGCDAYGLAVDVIAEGYGDRG